VTVELTYLVYVAVFTGLMWVPYILNLIAVRGLSDAVGYPAEPKPIAAWAQRLKAAHYNAIENLVVFATLILVAHVTGANGAATATCAMVYFWARIVHALAYTFAVSWVRTLAFAVGVGAMLCIAAQLM
jgi:uncharacterized MAPEG superfamily protein